VGSFGDSFSGIFYSLDESLVIEHDIGFNAGVFAGCSGEFFQESIVDGARVWIGEDAQDAPDGRHYRATVSFPGNGHELFSVHPPTTQDSMSFG
jgi:hypothetical protein